MIKALSTSRGHFTRGSTLRVVAFLSVAALGSSARGQSFQGLGDLPGGDFSSSPGGVSADGSVVVGSGAITGGETEAFRWTEATGIVGLGDLPGGLFRSFGLGISDNGLVIVGEGVNADNSVEGFRWVGGGMVGGLGTTAYAASADGSVVVGGRSGPNGPEAFRWTPGGGLVGLGDLPGGSFASVAAAVSADGSVVIGTGAGAVGSGEAFRWTAAEGMVGLGKLPGDVFSRANGASSDGSVVVGVSHDGTSYRAVRWTPAGGIEALAGCVGQCHAHGVTADGSTIVGQRGNEAFIWTEAEGMRSLKSVLETEYGLDLTGWTLQSAHNITPDGSVIVGRGLNPAGQGEAWRAGLSAQCEEPLVLRSWQDPSGGPFADPSNWSGGGVPGSADRALFGLPDGVDYTVMFGAGHTNDQLLLRGGNHVRLALGGHGYVLSGASGCGPAVDVADDFATPRLEIENGVLIAVTGGVVSGPTGTELTIRAGGLLNAVEAGLTVAPSPGRAGSIVVENGGAMDVLGGDILLGEAGEGHLRVEGGGVADARQSARLGVGVEGRGFLNVSGPGAQLRADGDVVAGHAGFGSVVVGENGDLDAGALRLGRLSGAVGTLGVNGNAHVRVNDLDVGGDGIGSVVIDGLAAVQVDAATSIPREAGNGTVQVHGTGGLISGIIRIGVQGPGRLAVYGTVFTGQLIAGPGSDVDLAGGCLSINGGPCQTMLGGSGGTIEADTVWVAPGAVIDSASVQLGPGGVLGGAGTLSIDLTNAGTINPGDSAGVAGTFTIGGAYTQAAGGVLEIELGGTAAGAYDRLTVTGGSAALDGTLRFSHINGFTPAPGDAFEVLNAASISGSFADVQGPAGSTYSIDYGPASVTATVLTVANEPPAGAAGLVLHPPVPNPASGLVTIRYELPTAGYVTVALHDALGREVAVLVDGQRTAGNGSATLDAGRLAPGIYIARLSSPEGLAWTRFTIR